MASILHHGLLDCKAKIIGRQHWMWCVTFTTSFLGGKRGTKEKKLHFSFVLLEGKKILPIFPSIGLEKKNIPAIVYAFPLAAASVPTSAPNAPCIWPHLCAAIDLRLPPDGELPLQLAPHCSGEWPTPCIDHIKFMWFFFYPSNFLSLLPTFLFLLGNKALVLALLGMKDCCWQDCCMWWNG